MADTTTTVIVDGREIKLTNLDKVLYPATGTTKGEVLRYYALVAPALLKHARKRPATRKRWPNGVEAESFFEKNLPKHTPDWVKRADLQHTDRVISYPLIDDQATLIYLAQGAALELHIPQWTYDVNMQETKVPDRLVIDLDPGAPAGLAECCEVALAARELLSKEGLEAFPVTSGSKGMQLYASVAGRALIKDTNQYAHELANQLARELADLVVSTMAKVDRKNKIFVDWSQNNRAKTTIAPYSMRGREHPNVAAPRTWDEIEAGNVKQLSFQEVIERFEADGDPLRLD